MEYFTETLFTSHRQSLAVDEVIFQQKGVAQDILVFRNSQYGRVLALEGAVQLTEGDEFIYHEMMAHLPLFTHGAAQNVLIIGGGDGGTLRHVLMHSAIRRVVMVEIEPDVIELAKRYFPAVCGEAFEDARTQLIIGDGCAYVRDTEERFDVIIVDGTDPVGPGKVLYTPEFYQACRRCLNPGGVLRTHAGMAMSLNGLLGEVAENLRHIFSTVEFSLAAIPTYMPGAMIFAMATDHQSLFEMSETTIAQRHLESGVSCRYYTPQLHKASGALPQYVLDALRAGGKSVR